MRLQKLRILSLFLLVVATCSMRAESGGKESFEWAITGPMGGDVRSLVIDPSDPERLYIGTIDGQIYTSVDGGKNWSHLKAFNRPGLFIDQILVDSRNSATIYVAAHRHKEPGGFFKSIDHGTTWREAKELKNDGLHSIAQSPSNPELLLAGGNRGIYRSLDAGESWTQIDTSSYPEITQVESLAIDPRSVDTIYAGTWRQLWKTTDGGKLWVPTKKEMIGDKDVFGITIDPVRPDNVVVAACNGVFETQTAGKIWRKLPGIPEEAKRTPAAIRHPVSSKTLFAGTTKGLWRSINGGVSWTLVTSNQLEINSIAIHPKKAETVYLGTNNHGVMISNDGGRSFTPSNEGFSGRRIYTIMADSSKSGLLYTSTTNTATGGGFFFISTDNGSTWQASMQGMPSNLSTYSILQNRKDQNTLYLGTNNGLYYSKDRGASWSSVSSAETKVDAIYALADSYDEQDGYVGIVAATNKGLYKIYDPSKAWISLQYGKQFDLRTLSVVVDIKDPKRMWVGTTSSGLLTTDDGGTSWQQVKDVPTATPINIIKQDERQPDRLYIGTGWSLYVSTNRGGKWTRRGGNLPLGNYTSIAINPEKSEEIFVSNASEDGGIYYSMDAGNSWQRIDPQLPSKRMWTLAFDRSGKSRLLVGSHSAGIYSVRRR
jgi:photosystem II stability/assembly factor-like uncharacterized protein